MIRFAFAPILAALLLGPGLAHARTLEVGEGREFKLPSDAVKAARAGDTVQLQPGEYFDCATVPQAKLTIEGVGDASKVLITDKTCGGKALLITTGADITVRNLTLTRARVPDGNGAGIRSEGATLLVDGVRFINNENGILSGTEGATIIVRNSYFERNGTCQRSCAHGIYIGHAKLLRVENSKFFDTRQGHHIKSRAERTEVVGCTLDDGEDGTASYMIEAPNGGSLIVRDSTLTKGPQSENHTGAIVIGTEGVTQPTREITITNNTFRNAGDYPTSFVWNLTATDAMLTGNRISGQAKPLTGDGKATR
ncbi:MAG TPA: right-handed parallel beta-helix repeat-containing protein [Acetobacteraceae bacterium]